MPDAVFAIPPRVRRAVLNILGGWQVTDRQLVSNLGTRHGFTTIVEVFESLSDRYGEDAAIQASNRKFDFDRANTDSRLFGADTAPGAFEPAVEHAESILIAIPDDLFAAAVEAGRDMAAANAYALNRIEECRSETLERIADLLVNNGVPYHFVEDRLVPSGSATASVASVQPAMDVLNDTRLSRARSHFLDARRRLEEPDADEAVDEARVAIEYGMLALLDASGIPRPTKHQPNDLFNALIPTIPRHAEELVLGATRFRGRTSAGHAGGPPVSLAEAEAVVAGAAAALLYLAAQLP